MQGQPQRRGGEARSLGPAEPFIPFAEVIRSWPQGQQTLPRLDQPGKRELLLLAQALHPADVLQIEAYRIRGDGCGQRQGRQGMNPAWDHWDARAAIDGIASGLVAREGTSCPQRARRQGQG